MTIPADEAARALKEAEAAAGRSATAASYQRTSPYLLLWGVIWIVANLLGFARAPHGTLLWLGLVSAGMAGSLVIGLRTRLDGRGRHRALHSLVVTLAIFMFSVGLGVISPATAASFVKTESLICLAVGAAYMVMGISTGIRLSAVGFAVMAGTIAVNLWAGEQFFLGMAVVGGGGLLLGGLWLRRA